MKLRITSTPTEEEKDRLYCGLLKYNLKHIETSDVREIGIFMEEEHDGIIGGLVGDTHGNWLTVEYLWVSADYRNQSIGSEILQKAEEEARQRGCRYVFLNTFGFQAPLFYEKYGYQKVFTLENYPLTGQRIYYTKTL